MNRPLANAFGTSCSANFENLRRLGSGCNHQIDGEIAAAGQRRRERGNGANAGNLRERPLTSISNRCVVLVRSLHGLVTKPPKPLVGYVSWKIPSASGNDR